MGYSTQSISFFSDEIKIRPHTASDTKYLDKPVTIREFAAGSPVTLEQRDDNGDYIVAKYEKGRVQPLEFMEGPEITTRKQRLQKIIDTLNSTDV